MAKPTLRIRPVWACPMGRPAYSEVVSKCVQHTVSIVEVKPGGRYGCPWVGSMRGTVP